ncbi:MAG: hypothetical protein PHV06_01880 [bacterium]|nr:hypothetical protein [bacterium]
MIKKTFLLILIINMLVLIPGCKTGDPEETLLEFITLIKTGKHQEAFRTYVDNKDLMQLLGYSFTPADIEDQNKRENEFNEFWKINSQKINSEFLKSIESIENTVIEEKQRIGEDYSITVKTEYKNGLIKREKIYLRRQDKRYLIVFSKMEVFSND